MDTNVLATMISLGCYDGEDQTTLSGEIKLTPEQAKMIGDALDQGKKVKITITD